MDEIMKSLEESALLIKGILTIETIKNEANKK